MPTKAERMRQLNPGVDDATLAKATKTSKSEQQSKRTRTGSTFQRDLDATHEQLLGRGQGLVMRQHVPFRMTKDGWRTAGHARCDYAGHVNLVTVPGALEGEYTYRLDALGNPTPVYFDAKVQKTDHASYTHPVDAQHQLIDLRAALGAGGYAFLLVHVPQLERAVLLGIVEHFEDLMCGRPILLYERVPYGSGGYARLVAQPLVPSCSWTALHGWEWPAALAWLDRGRPTNGLNLTRRADLRQS